MRNGIDRYAACYASFTISILQACSKYKNRLRIPLNYLLKWNHFENDGFLMSENYRFLADFTLVDSTIPFRLYLANFVRKHCAILTYFVFYHKTFYIVLTVHSEYLHIFSVQTTIKSAYISYLNLAVYKLSTTPPQH